MLVLHGSWALRELSGHGSFAVWAESSQRTVWRKAPGAASAAPARHSFSAGPTALLATVGQLGGKAFAGPSPWGDVYAQLPSAEGRPLPSPALAAGTPVPDGGAELAWWRLPTLSYGAVRAVELLLALAGAADPPVDVRLGDDLVFWTGPRAWRSSWRCASASCRASSASVTATPAAGGRCWMKSRTGAARPARAAIPAACRALALAARAAAGAAVPPGVTTQPVAAGCAAGGGAAESVPRRSRR